MKDAVKEADLTMDKQDKNGWKERRPIARQLFQKDDDVNNGDENGQNEIDHNNVLDRIAEEIRESQNDARRRWNFDFQNEVPLPGRYQWVRVNNNHGENGIANSTRPINGVDNSQGRQPENLEIEKEETSEED